MTNVEATRGRAFGTDLRDVLDSMERLAGGLGTAILALAALCLAVVTALLCLTGIGIRLVPGALGIVRSVAGRERARLARRGHTVLDPYQERAAGPRRLVADAATRRDLLWLCWHATGGLAIGLVGVVLPVLAVRDTTFPLWWRLLPAGQGSASLGVPATTWLAAAAVSMLGLGWGAIIIGLGGVMSRLQDRPGLLLLGPPRGTDVSGRVAELTAARAAVLDAHRSELRRIERSLHDGAQSRLTAVAVLVGTARMALARDPASADEVLAKAQGAAEEALAELRSVVREIFPPVLEQRGLGDALAALAAGCAVPCRVAAGPVARGPLAAEAIAYFVAAEALTNVSRHSHATHAEVTVRRVGNRLRIEIRDDGRGGAAERGGGGLAGIRRRVAAQDGTLTVASPPGGPTSVAAEIPCG